MQIQKHIHIHRNHIYLHNPALYIMLLEFPNPISLYKNKRYPVIISHVPRLGKSSTILTYFPVIRPLFYLWFLLVAWFFSIVASPSSSSFSLSLFPSPSPLSEISHSTFPFYCPITGSSLYWPIRMGKRFTWDHLSMWSISHLGQPLSRKQN